MSCSLHYHETPQEMSRISRSGHPMAADFSILPTLQTLGDAFAEALAACRHYEHLRSSGVPHDNALRAALGIGTVRACAT